MKPKAFSYLRFSTPEQLKGDSLRRQAKLAEDYVRTHGLDLNTELNLKDLGVSAYRGANVETGALGAFLQAVRSKIVPRGSFLLVESLDRVSRKTARKAVRILEDIVEQGVAVVTLNDGKVYTEESLEGFDFLFAVLILIRAHEESDTKAKRLRAAWVGKRLRASTQALTAHTPGWIELNAERKPVLIEERAAVVKRIVKDYMRGVGKHNIAATLNRENVPTFRKAVRWHRSYIDKILSSPALVGTFVPHIEDHSGESMKRIPQEPVANYFPAVLDADTYERLRELNARSPLRGRHTHAPMRNVLAALARCPLCGSTMTRTTKGARAKAGKPFLVCVKAKSGGGCKYHAVPVEAVEAGLRDYELILREMPHPDAKLNRDMLSAQAAVDDLQSRLGELLEALERRASDAVAARVAKLEVSLKAAEQVRDALASQASQSERKVLAIKADALGVAMRARPVSRERINVAMRALFEAVVIDYRTGHLRFRWRHDGETSVLYAWPK